jgi:hypothetical protein
VRQEGSKASAVPGVSARLMSFFESSDETKFGAIVKTSKMFGSAK